MPKPRVPRPQRLLRHTRPTLIRPLHRHRSPPWPPPAHVAPSRSPRQPVPRPRDGRHSAIVRCRRGRPSMFPLSSAAPCRTGPGCNTNHGTAITGIRLCTSFGCYRHSGEARRLIASVRREQLTAGLATGRPWDSSFAVVNVAAVRRVVQEHVRGHRPPPRGTPLRPSVIPGH
jgi:hypothetical protein